MLFVRCQKAVGKGIVDTLVQRAICGISQKASKCFIEKRSRDNGEAAWRLAPKIGPKLLDICIALEFDHNGSSYTSATSNMSL
jgi:hypothetical protein